MKINRCLGLLIVAALVSRGIAAETNEFIISYWWGPPVGGNYDAQYAEVAECNFTHAMFAPSGATKEQNHAILDACEKHGLKYFLQDGRILGRQPGDPVLEADLDAVVADYGSHPALAGYYLVDEPAPGAFPQLAAVNQYLLKKDPKRLPYINLLPNYVPEAWIGTKYDDYLDKFCSIVKPKLLSYDHYALFKGVERDKYFANLESVRRHALKYDIPMGFIFQCTPHGTYRDTSDTDLRWQVNTALAYGCKALFYFTYFTPTDPAANFHNGILDAKGNRTPHFNMAKEINAELKNLIPTLVKLKSTAVYHTAPIPGGCTALPKDAPVQVRGGQLVIGILKHADGSQWAIVVNRDLHKPASAELTIAAPATKLEDLSPQTGKLPAVALANGGAKFELPAGGIKILKLANAE